jgi:hypothetical protein
MDLLDPVADDICFGSVELSIEEGAHLPPGMIAKVRFSPLMYLDMSTPDGRKFYSQGFEHRDLPVTLFYKNKTTDAPGHAEAFVVGTVEEVELHGNEVHGWGYLIDDADARRALVAIKTRAVKGVSADLGLGAAPMDPSQDELAAEPQLRVVYPKSTLQGLTIVPIPAFPGTRILIDDFVASAKVSRSSKPKREWLSNPKLKELTGIIVKDNGHFYGHLAPINQCHIGNPNDCETIPLDDNFDHFYTGGGVLCDNGEFVRTGRMFLGGQHAPGRVRHLGVRRRPARPLRGRQVRRSRLSAVGSLASAARGQEAALRAVGERPGPADPVDRRQLRRLRHALRALGRAGGRDPPRRVGPGAVAPAS